MVERLGKRDDEPLRVPACGGSMRHALMSSGIDGRAHTKDAPELLLEWQPVFVKPHPVDDERHRAPHFERPAHLQVRQNAFLDSAGIEEHGEPRWSGLQNS